MKMKKKNIKKWYQSINDKDLIGNKQNNPKIKKKNYLKKIIEILCIFIHKSFGLRKQKFICLYLNVFLSFNEI